MEISDLRLVDVPPSPRGFQTIARFSLDVTPECRIFDCQAVRAPDGKVTIYPPKMPGGFNIAAIAPNARRQIASQIIEVINRASHTSRSAA